MRKSISRKVRRKTVNGLDMVGLSDGSYRDAYSVEVAFGKLPEGNYTVTYTRNREGDFLVERQWNCNSVRKAKFSVFVCFLPDSWIGFRVRRKVSIG